MPESDIVPDSEARAMVARAGRWRALVMLARLDRPIGAWLLFWPCAWGLALASGLRSDPWLVAWFALGAVAMRGAGCVWNDVVDRDLDRQVARTRARPVASGLISVRGALGWMAALALIGMVVLLQLPPVAAAIALASLAPVAAYPFMKRITWWPQAWLGIVFSWGALVGWSAIATPAWPMALLYAGSIAWVVGYDTIYALQDIEDDALVGVKSSARRLGARVRLGISVSYGMALALWAGALWVVRPDPLALVALIPVALHLAWQVGALKSADGLDALAKFRSNRTAGLLMFLACAVVGSA